MKGFRILGRNIRDSFKSVFRNFSLSLASISCITITLIVVAVSLILSFNVNNFTEIVEDDVTIVAFLDVDITEKEIDNVYDTITVNKNNLNTNFNQDTRLNDCSSSNKDNNEKIISELNIINHNNSNNNNGSFDEPSHNSLISDLQKKINEQNILLSTRKKEIENLKNQINKYKNNDIKEDRQEIEKNKNNY